MFIISDLMNYFSGLNAETIQIISSITAVIASIVAIFVVFLTRYLSERDLKRKCVDALLSEIGLNYHEVNILEDSINDILKEIDRDDEGTSIIIKKNFHKVAFQNFLLNGYLIQTSDDLYTLLADFYYFLNVLEEGMKIDNSYFLFFQSEPDISDENRMLNFKQMLDDIKITKKLFEDDLNPYLEGEETIL